MTAFDLSSETKAAKIAQILHFLKKMNTLFDEIHVF